MGKMIYLDNAATTKTAPEVVEAMLPYFTEFYGNASTVYDFAANSKAAIAKGRQQIADVIGAKKEEIYFTAGGSESDNWALKPIPFGPLILCPLELSISMLNSSTLIGICPNA